MPDEPNWILWAQRDLWMLLDAAALLIERDPLANANSPGQVMKQLSDEGAREQFDRIYTALKDATNLYKSDGAHPKGLRCHAPTALSPGTAPIGRRQVEPEDVMKWAPSKGIKIPQPLLDALSETKKRPPLRTDTRTDWQEEARRIADECFDKDTENGCRDSLAGYSTRVMERMQERQIHGPRGRITNHNTIQREALQGKKWWANKQK